MKIERDTRGEIIFWATVVLGMVLYFLSSPSGLPWSGSTQVALAWAGQIAELPEMPHPVWGYFIQVFGGRFIALSSLAAAVAGGLIGAIANRYLGWRVGATVALAWLFLPGVWNRAVTGAHGMFWAFGVVLAVWLANAVFLIVTRRARRVTAGAGAENKDAALEGVKLVARQSRVRRIVGRSFLGAAVLFALVSLVEHDYSVGEAASAYARLVLDEAGDRLVILSGVADDQMVWEAERREPGSSERLLSFRNDAAYRTQLVARVQRNWPGETNLWVAAQVGPQAFADLAVRKHRDQVYLMNGRSTTPEQWASRWEALKPWLKSSDSFIPVLRRVFAFEGNIIGNRLQDEGMPDAAWDLYWRVIDEVDADNTSAYVNLSEMMRHGHKADAQKRKRVEERMARVKKDLAGKDMVKCVAAIMAASGPVRQDAERMAEIQARINGRIEELKKEGVELSLPPELKTLAEWNNEMLLATDAGDMKTAGRIARTILSRHNWRGFVPANVVMGALMACEGDYVSSAAFYETAVLGEKNPPAVVCNDYADTLLHLGRLDEAEKYARLAVERTDEKAWIFRLTLAEILRDAKKNPEEVKALLRAVLPQAPKEMRARIRKEFPRK